MHQASLIREPASLGAKLVMIMTAVGIVGALGITLLLAAIITPSFEKLEARATAAQVDHVRAAIGAFSLRVEKAARDYDDRKGDFDVDGVAYVATNGRIVSARWSGAAGGVDTSMQTHFRAAIARIHLAPVMAGKNSTSFYARIGNGVAAIGVAQVGHAGDRAPRGYVVMARELRSQGMSDLLRFDARVEPMPLGNTPVVDPDSRKLTIAVPMIGADGHAVASIRFSVPREVSMLGRRVLMLAVAGSIVLLLLVLTVLRWMIAHLVLRPLHRVERHMQRVRASGSLALLDEESRRDEIGSLGRSFNAMLRQLKDLRGQLQVQSFDLGRSESAVAVMHNVRNALNPISTILSQGVAQSPPIDRAVLDRAVVELAGDDVPSDRREKLAAFVAAAVQAQVDDRENTRHELAIGREALAHVLEIIGQQQEAANERLTLEPCDVTEIIARNATIARYSEDASIAFSFPAQEHQVMANRVILSQVIGNLFGNAAESIVARGQGSGTIAAAVTDCGSRVTIAIRDDGEGFSPEIAAALFQRGFSTRAHKSGGLGLHWCANSMTAMDGALRLESDGPGRGAVATLTLPATRAMSVAA